jgi:hypothetical protein
VKFTVRWKETSTNELAALWIDADAVARREMTAAAREIDRVLEVNPGEVGESRPDGRRIAFFRPLAVTFVVDHERAVVRVLRIRQY